MDTANKEHKMNEQDDEQDEYKVSYTLPIVFIMAFLVLAFMMVISK